MKLKNKSVLVTGGAVGYKSGGPSIGSDIAFKFASEGANIVIIDNRKKMGEKTAEIIIENGGKAIFIQTDVSLKSDVKKAIEITENEFGSLYIRCCKVLRSKYKIKNSVANNSICLSNTIQFDM